MARKKLRHEQLIFPARKKNCEKMRIYIVSVEKNDQRGLKGEN
jgi:hypothetical protein